MKFSENMMLCSFLLTALLFSSSSAEVEQSKTRRGGGGTAGLFAFPRVGRSDPSLSEQTGGYDNLFPASYEEYDEYPKISEMKRAKMVAFPRVGRSDSQLRNWARMAALQQSLDKRTAPSANSGLWFGPRLGRIQKRSIMDDEHKTEQL
ncbi:cardio acceleratory peptide 2b [Eupeodes corollae]|uniref:cardio acceleratory peptide 2b n=1 Tax=Eupeodes corollae TaxID=290404 RepID=UPI002493984F|nr:cardio acceleratory peptide 2b [Eupeodes corollae]